MARFDQDGEPLDPQRSLTLIEENDTGREFTIGWMEDKLYLSFDAGMHITPLGVEYLVEWLAASLDERGVPELEPDPDMRGVGGAFTNAQGTPVLTMSITRCGCVLFEEHSELQSLVGISTAFAERMLLWLEAQL